MFSISCFCFLSMKKKNVSEMLEIKILVKTVWMIEWLQADSCLLEISHCNGDRTFGQDIITLLSLISTNGVISLVYNLLLQRSILK